MGYGLCPHRTYRLIVHTFIKESHNLCILNGPFLWNYRENILFPFSALLYVQHFSLFFLLPSPNAHNTFVVSQFPAPHRLVCLPCMLARCGGQLECEGQPGGWRVPSLYRWCRSAPSACDHLSFSLAKTVTVSLTAPNTPQNLIDSDELLDPEDLKKPDPASLRAPACGEGKKRKACKNW